MIFTRNVFYAALLLMVSLLSIAGLYILAWAEFLALAQIMVYAGGILVVILFGIMLTSKLGKNTLIVEHGNLFSGTLIALLFVGIVSYHLSGTIPDSALMNPPTSYDNHTSSIGLNLMTEYMLPFEIAGILLLIALIGAAVIASHKSKSA